MTTQHRTSPPLTSMDTGATAGPAGVESLSSAAACAWAQGVLEDTRNHDPITSLRVLRGGAKRLAVVSFEEAPDLVLKQYADDRGAWTQRWLRRLAAAGFASPSRLGVTRTRGWSRTHRTLVTDLAPQHPWTSWMVAAPQHRDAAAKAAADWLSSLQTLEVSLPDRSSFRAAEDLQRQCRELSTTFPTHAASLQSASQLVHARLYSSGPHEALVPSHGDLHPNNLHIAVDGLRVVGIDVDTAGMRRPSYDVGYALAQMLIVSWMRNGSFHAGAAAGRVFWHRWSAHSSHDADTVGAESARALIQSLHFELITYRNGRTDLLGAWLHVAHLALTIGLPNTLDILSTAEEITS
ncbi:phosphotransferase [Tessaracoccus sp.]